MDTPGGTWWYQWILAGPSPSEVRWMKASVWPVLLLVVGGCMSIGDPDAELEDIELVSINGLSANALTANALTANALTANALTANALTANALTANALTANAL